MILHFLQRMAELDGRPRTLQSTPETIRGAMFGDRPQVLVLLAEVDDGVVGFASYVSTWTPSRNSPAVDS